MDSSIPMDMLNSIQILPIDTLEQTTPLDTLEPTPEPTTPLDTLDPTPESKTLLDTTPLDIWTTIILKLDLKSQLSLISTCCLFNSKLKIIDLANLQDKSLWSKLNNDILLQKKFR